MRSQLCNNHFTVEWGGARIGFTEVSGLSMELDVVPYRDGSSPDSAATLLPGQKLFAPVVLKRGLVPGDNSFFEWINGAQFSQVERRDVTIQLLNERHEPVIVWRLVRAFPSRLDYSPLSALGSEVAIESLTLVHEGFNVQHTA
jgi:phage tail-like protein